ncbi:MAG TPA: NUDIX domain-containing protein [Candidatus Saccharimonadales bacterium]|nr:NUDIX domain-containing protein [Candidatus Saccharimonadales bacterium]
MSDRFKPYAAVLLFLIKDDSILLIRRFNTGWADGSYTVPSGHIDGNESLTVAAAREAKEEVDVTVRPKDLEFVHVMHRMHPETMHEYIDSFFVAREWKGEPKVNEPDKCDEVKWFSLDNLPENMIPFVRDVIMSYKSGKRFSEVGW